MNRNLKDYLYMGKRTSYSDQFKIIMKHRHLKYGFERNDFFIKMIVERANNNQHYKIDWILLFFGLIFLPYRKEDLYLCQRNQSFSITE